MSIIIKTNSLRQITITLEQFKQLSIQPIEISRQFILQDGLNIQYVTEQTHELCNLAVKQNGAAIHYINLTNLTKTPNNSPIININLP